MVRGWMGMSLARGKWRAPEPDKKNVFTFRWGPLFEDCRGEWAAPESGSLKAACRTGIGPHLERV